MFYFITKSQVGIEPTSSPCLETHRPAMLLCFGKNGSHRGIRTHPLEILSLLPLPLGYVAIFVK